MLTGMAALTLHDADLWIKTHDIATAMTLEALNANMIPYDAKLHELRGFKGSMETAENLRMLIEGSKIMEQK